jgi:cytochrome c oxidase accessory protein FixG
MFESSDNFRDRVSTIDRQGKRVWIYPKKPRGFLTRSREIASILLLAFFISAPFIKINQQPLLLFNILERKFVLLGVVFWPQDIYLFVLATIILIVFVVLFTVVFGRLWCGWACPQTVFMEMVFRKIEYWIEGDSRKQTALNQAPWSTKKLLKKTVKHLIFYAISFLIGNIFLAYIIGIDQLFKIISDPPRQHLLGLTAMILFSGVFYWIFAFFREQVCTMVCPYGRLQGVLLDPNSIVVAYDFKRGEPRGKFRRSSPRGELGDCIECLQCVEVCPTGIDIRNGTQLECINCTACIDACNAVMKKVNLPSGLIRYTSYNGILNRAKLKITPRIIGYSLILFLLIILTTTLVVTRNLLDISFMRTPGLLFQETAEGTIANLYNLKIINKTDTDKSITLKLKSPPGSIKIVGGKVLARPNEVTESVVLVEIDKEKIKFISTPVYIDIFADNQLIKEVRTSFSGPDKKQ